ncbi:MAG: hypothetical protein QOE70_2203 [Chthoniobacter sp.]|jgi:uncharacterized membrane protein|nr:hypothetical protein [Chthoniobacter sp.]
MKFLPLCALLLLLLAPTPGPAADASAEGTMLAGRVREIFEAKCLDCHGPELPRPKGKFGYVLDLKRVAENSEWVERGKGESSELYKLVFSDEMPGEDANVPPLTTQEKETVKRWIDLGAPEPPAVAADHVPVTVVEQAHELPLWKHTLRWIGKFHPVSTHIPVGLMFVAVLAEALAWWTRREAWLQTVRFLVIIAALGALAAAPLGWMNAWFTSYVGESKSVLEWHRWLGTAAALWAAVCAGLASLSKCEEGSKERQRFRGALLVGAVLVGISGFLGSALIYGLDHYAWK